MKQINLERETAATQARYQRIAPVYDLIEVMPERSYRPWRECLWSLAKGPKILEVGVYVFCSVPDPVRGLQEVLRVLSPGAQALFIEHVRSENILLGALMDLTNPLVVSMMGSNINRRTLQNIQCAQFEIEKVEDLGPGGIFKLIIARKPDRKGRT